ncbi:hypothetical protein RJ639_007767 [Escallonia herrerae]|uniref:Arabinogalactan peptide 23-like n=1 Tax=Escallonia herrerae TaxID=1293975 RepID=A0AA89AU92_9ASTE|nr:hypothetical protein RJ639_007767 [Escallonia herrerae]
MEMKKIACAALVAAASMSAALAQAPASAPSSPPPLSDAAAALPVIGSLVGASLLSFFAFYMH